MRHLVILIFLLCSICFAAGQESGMDPVTGDVPQQNAPQMPSRPKVEILFEPVVKVLADTPIQIGLKIEATREGDQVFIHFREAGRLDFNSTPMGFNPMTKQYETEIDERFHGNEPIEYYIEVFPVGLSKIRLPEDIESVYTVVMFTNFNDIMRMILIALAIPSPIFIVYLINRLQKAHQKRTVVYQQKLKKRERQLTKQREKHYQEYVKKMTGGKAVTRPDATKVVSSSPTKPASIRPNSSESSRPMPVSAEDNSVADSTGELILENTDQTTYELKRELDEILSGKSSSPGSPTPSPTRKPSARSPQTSPAAIPHRDTTPPAPSKKPPLKPPVRPAPKPETQPQAARSQVPTSPPPTSSKPANPQKPPVTKSVAPQRPSPSLSPGVTSKPNPSSNVPSKSIPAPSVTPKPVPSSSVNPVRSQPAPGNSRSSASSRPEVKPVANTEKKKPDTRSEREKLLDLLGLDDL